MGGPVAEFFWEGDDEGDQRSGRGWLRSEPPDASSAMSTSTAATIQASSASRGEFFNGLLVQ